MASFVSDADLKDSRSVFKEKASKSDDEPQKKTIRETEMQMQAIIMVCCPNFEDKDIKGKKFEEHKKNVEDSLSKLEKCNLKPKLYNDPIHGSIWLNPLESAILNTPEFYRLRHIKQLGGKCYVYPGAVHTRFEHSIGVCHLAGEFIKHLQKQSDKLISEQEETCIRLAGLCHDLGHGPFSHVFEEVIKEIYPKEEDHDKIKHEKVSVLMFKRILMEHANILALFIQSGLRAEHVTMIEEMIDCSEKLMNQKMKKRDAKKKLYLWEIVANKKSGMDVDKWDYFARDCYFLGIQYAFDYKRCMALSKIIQYKFGGDNEQTVEDDEGENIEDDKGENVEDAEGENVEDAKGENVDDNKYDLKDENGCHHIAFRDKEIQNIYGMFRTRCMIHQKACTHKVVSAIEMMIKDAIYAAKDLKLFKFHDDDDSQHSLKTILDSMIDDGEVKLSGYMQLTDGILDLIMSHREKEQQDKEIQTSEARDSQESEEEEILQDKESQVMTESQEAETLQARDCQDTIEKEETKTSDIGNSKVKTKQAQAIVKRIIERKTYSPVRDSKSKDDEIVYPNLDVPELSKSQRKCLKKLQQKRIGTNYEIECACISYASEKKDDPVKGIHFYSKAHEKSSDPVPILESKIMPKQSHITTPKSFVEFRLRLFRKVSDPQDVEDDAAWKEFNEAVKIALTKGNAMDTRYRRKTY